MENVSIGNELKDAFKKTDKWLGNNLAWLADIESFYKQRSAIEKEYATKLQALCSESFKKKAKVSTTVSVGDEPTITPGSLENSTLVVWNDILNKTELIAKEKFALSNNLNTHIADKIGRFQRIADSLQKKYNDLNALVNKEKSDCYSDLKKAKQAYDGACENMEHVRSKVEKSSSTKSTKKLSEKEVKMNVYKNSYLIKINQANRLKDKYYYQDLPEILDGLQDLNEFKTNELNNLWKEAITMEENSNNTINGHLHSSVMIIEQNDFHLDTIMFIKHNIEPWNEPKDFYYEPSPIWHDDDKIITNSEELSDLKKRLAVANNLFLEKDQTCEKLQEKISEVNQLKISMKKNHNIDSQYKKSLQYYVDESIQCLKAFITNDNKRVAAEVEMQTIQSNAGDKDLTLTEPLQQKKKSRLGFLKKKNGSSAGETNSSTLNRADSIMSTATTATAHSHKSRGFASIMGNKLRQSNATALSRADSSASSIQNESTTTVLVEEGTASYPYQSTADDEVSVAANEKFEIVEPDDGSGWTKVLKENGERGLVPTSYIVISQIEKTVSSSSKKALPPKVAPRRGAKKLQQAKALYDYQADGDDELSLGAGDTIAILEPDDGSGWTLGELKGAKGLFPTLYVQIL